MLRGIARKWKQPVLYQFVKGSTKAPQIMKNIKEIIREAEKAGFNVVGTICDQGASNVSAITKLVADTRAEYLRERRELHDYVFEVDGKTIIPLFDTPHLLKCVRNHLLKDNIFYEINGVQKVAKWDDISTAWQLDSFSGEIRVMHKLTEFHVNRQKIKKMKVSNCAQIFSHNVSSAINLMARTSKFQL